ncbi:hypothetical protein LQW54_008579 [Pestalotiopsis sp. IQ-011]
MVRPNVTMQAVTRDVFAQISRRTMVNGARPQEASDMFRAAVLEHTSVLSEGRDISMNWLFFLATRSVFERLHPDKARDKQVGIGGP